MDDATAQWYVERYGEHFTNRMIVQLAELRPDDVVLDVGCGSGTAVREASAKLSGGQAIGVDPSPAMLRIAAEKTLEHPARSRIEFLEGDASHLPVPDASVTVVWAINSLHHWDDAPRGLSEVRRVLVSGGRFFITEEELSDGRFGHAERPLSDPEFVVGQVEQTGFRNVLIRRHAQGKERMVIIAARRPADQA